MCFDMTGREVFCRLRHLVWLGKNGRGLSIAVFSFLHETSVLIYAALGKLLGLPVTSEPLQTEFGINVELYIYTTVHPFVNLVEMYCLHGTNYSKDDHRCSLQTKKSHIVGWILTDQFFKQKQIKL
jgi:hypothetical protein